MSKNGRPKFTPQEIAKILNLGHRSVLHKEEVAVEVPAAGWPKFRCAQCGELSVGGEHWQRDEAGVVLLACPRRSCRAVYQMKLVLQQVGHWEDGASDEAQGSTEEVH